MNLLIVFISYQCNEILENNYIFEHRKIYVVQFLKKIIKEAWSFILYKCSKRQKIKYEVSKTKDVSLVNKSYICTYICIHT